MTDYDAIVIGSGSGGLTAALALARAGKRVVVFEQHDHLGGYTQSFTLNGFQFSPGVHYIGGLEPGGDLRAISSSSSSIRRDTTTPSSAASASTSRPEGRASQNACGCGSRPKPPGSTATSTSSSG